ncbi:MAG: hypothetical protein QG570_304 [Patescibacteria group bacterium]|nr:hypothetical protein [Patescibacteria group bacterium]
MSTTLQGGQNPQPTQHPLFPPVTQEEYENQQSNKRKAEILICRNWIVENGDISFVGMEPIDKKFEERFASKVPLLGDYSYETVKAAMSLVAEELAQEGEVEGNVQFDPELAVGL